jgi:hypothetical protein
MKNAGKGRRRFTAERRIVQRLVRGSGPMFFSNQSSIICFS